MDLMIGRALGKIFWNSKALVVVLTAGLLLLKPQLLKASSQVFDLSVPVQSGETYEAFVRRAEMMAKAAVEKAFSADRQQETVVISISGQNQGAIAPILRLQVSRAQWQNQPEPQRWATFYPSSKMLLGFDRPVVPISAPTPQAIPTPQALPPQRQPVSRPVQPVPIDSLPSRPVVPQVIPGVPVSDKPIPIDQLPDNLLPGMTPQLPTEGTATEPVSTQPRTVEPAIVQPTMVQPNSIQPSSVQPGLILPSP
ncbi:MAG TPA: hypothetical protein V6D13_14875 [Halomicronema sp.]